MKEEPHIKITDDLGIHNSMKSATALFEDRRLSIVQPRSMIVPPAVFGMNWPAR